MTAKIWIPTNPIGLPSTADTAFVAAWTEYEQWHAAKGYWPNETPYGTLNAH